MNNKIYNMVTEKILAQLDAGVVPWRMPWVATGGAISHNTGRSYSLLNQYLLGKVGEYATYRQIEAEGGRVKKGAKAKPIVFWKVFPLFEEERVDDNGERTIVPRGRGVPYLKYYNVFHLDDTEGVAPKYEKELPNVANVDERAQKIATDYLEREGIKLYEGEIRDDAFYRHDDTIYLPHLSQFQSTAEYYSTLFHEITHSTGAEKRLDRKLTTDRSIQRRAQEELVAEMGAALLCAYAGIQTDDSLINSAAYIEHWRDHIAKDNTLVVVAAGRAQKAVEFILGINNESEYKNESA